MSSIVASAKTQVAATSNSSVNVERPPPQQAPSLQAAPTVKTMPSQLSQPPTISANPATQLKPASKLPPLKMPTLVAAPTSATKVLSAPTPSSTPVSLFTRTTSSTATTVTTPGSLLSGLKASLKSSEATIKTPLSAGSPASIIGKDKISFGMVDESILSKSLPNQKSRTLFSYFVVCYVFLYL